jgi:hypothetical protein
MLVYDNLHRAQRRIVLMQSRALQTMARPISHYIQVRTLTCNQYDARALFLQVEYPESAVHSHLAHCEQVDLDRRV